MKGWKTLFVIFLISLLVNVFVRGDCTILDNANLVSYYSFDNTYTDSGTGGYDITEVGTIFTDGVLNQAVYLSGAANSLLNVSDVTYFDATTQPMTFCFAFNYNNTATANQVIMDKFTVNNGWWIYFYATSTKLAFDIWGATTNILECQTNNTYASKTWYHMCVTWSGVGADKCAGVYWYQNGNLITTVAAQNNDPGAMTGNTKKLEIGHRSSALRSTGYLDEIFISKTALSATNISLLYNGGVLCNPTIAPPASNESTFTSINWDTASPLNDTGFNNHSIMFGYNVTTTNITNMNCTMYFTSDSSLPFWYQNIGAENINLSTTGNHVYNYTNYYDNEELWYFNLICYDYTNTSRYANSSIKTILWDTVNPTITSTFTNNTILTKGYDIYLRYNVTYSDANLYHWNHTIFKLNATDSTRMSKVYGKEQNASGASSVVAIYNYTIANSTWSSGRFESFEEAWDSHTGEVLLFDAKVEDDKVVYHNLEFYCDNVKDIDYIQETDRVKPTVTFLTIEPIQKCYYKGGELIKVKNSLYPNHYVDWTNKIWIDDYLGTSKLIDKNTLEITYTSVKGISTITTESFGDLNYVNKSWFFNISNGFKVYAKEYLENISLYNFTASVWSDYVGGTKLATRDDSGLGYVLFNITSGSYQVNVSKEIYVDNNKSVTFTENGSDTVYLWNQHRFEDIWLCDGWTYEAQAYNFTIKDEDYNQLLLGSIYVDIMYAAGNLSFHKVNINSLALCISSNGTTNYSVTGSVYSDVAFVHRYFLKQATLNTSTIYINLYNYNSTTGVSTLQWITRDYTWNILSGMIGKLQRYYPENHTWVTVQMDQAGEFGDMVFHIREEDYQYKLYIYDSTLSYIYESTDSMKFVCTSGLCQVTSRIVLASATEINIYPSYTYNNNTHLLTVTWDDPTGATSHVNVSVYQDTPSAIRYICRATVASASGSYVCNTTGYYGGAIVEVRSAASPEKLKYNWYVDLGGIAKLLNKIPIAESGLWTVGMILVMVGMGATGSPVAVIILLIASLWVQSALGLTPLITVPFLAMASIIGLIIAAKVKK